MNNGIHDQRTHAIIGCAMNVHNILGNGFQEVIYQRALSIEFTVHGIDFEREVERQIFYKSELIGSRRADFVVFGDILVELKAIVSLEDVHLAQIKNYLIAYDLPLGLLINFGSKSLEFKRVFP